VDMRLEVSVLPVSDVGRARDFYQAPDWYAQYLADESAGQAVSG
jgi:hypothetical protein